MTEELRELSEVRPFDEFLSELRRGQALHEAGEALQQLVKAVEETGKPGSLTLTIKLVPDAKYETAVGVSDDLSVKLPKPSKGASLFYMDGSHNLVRHDPAQMRIPTRED
jgi:hypothetical protein